MTPVPPVLAVATSDLFLVGADFVLGILWLVVARSGSDALRTGRTREARRRPAGGMRFRIDLPAPDADLHRSRTPWETET
ncbi:MAG: hypothetical protein FJ144_15880 [Deltaproteobacteria bacterium]|nr:hypothetical protein [Deltaproteobacteria bacterium]